MLVKICSNKCGMHSRGLNMNVIDTEWEKNVNTSARSLPETKNTLYGLRFVFIAMLMIQHMSWPITWGGMVVTFFLCIGGFLTAYNNCRKNVSYTREVTIKYYLRKIKKLYPLFLLSTILKVVQIIYFKTDVVLWGDLILHLLMAKALVPSNIQQIFVWGGANWYISTIMICYLATPFLYKGAMVLYNKVEKPVTLLMAAIVLWWIQLVIVLSIQEPMEAYSIRWWFVYVSPFRMVEYCIGMLVGIWYANIERKFDVTVVKNIVFSILEVGTIIVQVIMCYMRPRFSEYVTISMYWTWLYMAMIVLAAEGKGIISMLLATKPMMYLGKLNLVLYIMHQPIYALLMLCFGGSIYYQEGDPLNVVRTIFLFVVVIGVCDLLNRVMNVVPVKRRKVFDINNSTK